MNERIKTLDKHGGMKTRQELTIFASGVGKSIFWSRKMNERIKSLLAKAHLDIMEDLGDIDTNHVAERFAELIVKECAYLVNDQQRTTGYTTHAKMLCEQFGIEYKDEDYWGRE